MRVDAGVWLWHPCRSAEVLKRNVRVSIGLRVWTWRTRDVLAPCDFLPFQRKDRTIKPWDQTSKETVSEARGVPPVKRYDHFQPPWIVLTPPATRSVPGGEAS